MLHEGIGELIELAKTIIVSDVADAARGRSAINE
jgi:hypothetical protein